MPRREIVPVVKTYAVPPHIRRQVEKKQLAQQRKALAESNSQPSSEAAFSTPTSISRSTSATSASTSTASTSTSATSTSASTSALTSASASASTSALPTSTLPTSASSTFTASSTSASSLSTQNTTSSHQPTQRSRFHLLKRARKLLTPPQSPELVSITAVPKPLRMPEENKQLMRFCTVCASNQNRSMEAHKVLQENGYNVHSFGTGTNVRLPGPAMDKPQVYEFGTSYNQMYTELKRQNQRLYTSNGVLAMLDRNRHIKDHPEQWNKQNDVFDVVITCQEKCFDSVCLDLLHRGAKMCRPAHVINVEIEDNHHEASLGAKAILDFVNMVAQSGDPDAEMLEILRKWQKTHQKYPSMYQLCYC